MRFFTRQLIFLFLAKDFRAKWRAEGSEAKKAMDKVTFKNEKVFFSFKNLILDISIMKLGFQRACPIHCHVACQAALPHS